MYQPNYYTLTFLIRHQRNPCPAHQRQWKSGASDLVLIFLETPKIIANFAVDL